MSNLHRTHRRGSNARTKDWVPRHGSASKESANRCEKGIETRARDCGRRECEEGLLDWENEA
jgi:hypothetical protein